MAKSLVGTRLGVYPGVNLIPEQRPVNKANPFYLKIYLVHFKAETGDKASVKIIEMPAKPTNRGFKTHCGRSVRDDVIMVPFTHMNPRLHFESMWVEDVTLLDEAVATLCQRSRAKAEEALARVQAVLARHQNAPAIERIVSDPKGSQHEATDHFAP